MNANILYGAYYPVVDPTDPAFYERPGLNEK